MQGQRDTDLNPLGRRQAAAAGRTLKRVLDDHGLRAADRAFVASPLLRTRDTMEILRDELGDGLPPCSFDDRLREMSFGAWEGRSWDDLKRAEPSTIAARRRDTWAFVPPEGESYAMLLARVAPWLEALAPDSVVVAHGGVARVLLHHVAALGTERATTADIHQGRVLLFDEGAAHWI